MLADHRSVLVAALTAAGLFGGVGCGGGEFSAAQLVADARHDDVSPVPADASFDVRNGERADATSSDPQDGVESSMDGQDVVTADITGDTFAEAVIDAGTANDAVQDSPSFERSFDADREPDPTDGTNGGDASDAAPETTCNSTTYYHDRDRDGFGATSDSVVACTPPASDDAGAWVVDPGDCRDDLGVVKPDARGVALTYFGTGYDEPTKPQRISFDYNCDGVETPDPANAFGTEPTCPLLLTGCTGTGYLPATPSRTGTGIDPHCGSATLMMCVVSGLSCVTQTIVTAQAFRCR